MSGGRQISSSGNSYTFSDLTDGATYNIVVTAVNENGESADSTETSAMPYVWKSVSSGADYTLALRNDNTLWAWGGNIFGQLGDGNTWSAEPVKVNLP